MSRRLKRAGLGAAGVTQRVVRSAALATSTPSVQGGSAGRPLVGGGGGGGSLASYAHAMLPLFQPLPESQPVLPCLLRRLLQQVPPYPSPIKSSKTAYTWLGCTCKLTLSGALKLLLDFVLPGEG